jgi:hypothetical protein
MANNPCSGNSGWGNGSNSNAGTKAAPWLTIAYSVDQMSGGDTLIIDDGTYIGANNVLSPYSGNDLPVGTSGNYTIMKSENDGKVIFDGQNTRYMFYIVNSGARYWQFEGIIWARNTESDVVVRDASYIKFLRCGAYDAPNGNYVNFMASNASYILYEGCYAYGTGRYKFLAYHSNYIIFRNCVGRPDAINAVGEPAAVFSIYSSTYIKVQNCIAIDADQTSYWTNVGDRQGSFFVPCTDAVAQYVDFDNSIGLNVKLGGLQTMSNTDSANVNFRNMVIWDNTDDSAVLNMIRGTYNLMQNVTMGYSDVSTTAVFYWDGSNGTAKNNIFYHLLSSSTFWGGAAPSTQDYNAYYENSNTTGRTGAHDLTAADPITSIPYLVKVEASSAMDGAGESGADIGANILYLIGTSGTLYGGTGYATETAIKMWPFPNEALIREKMAAYTWDDGSGGDPEITGARGFATTSLTGYILNYLEPTNTITVTSNVTSVDDVNEYIYGESGETDEVDPIVAISDSDPKTLSSGYTTTLGFTSSDANDIDECKWRSGSAPDETHGTACTGTTSGTCSVTGLVQGNNAIYVGCADPTNNWGSDSITVNAPSYRAQAGGAYNVR